MTLKQINQLLDDVAPGWQVSKHTSEDGVKMLRLVKPSGAIRTQWKAYKGINLPLILCLTTTPIKDRQPPKTFWTRVKEVFKP